MVGALFCPICQIFPVWFHCTMFRRLCCFRLTIVLENCLQIHYITFQDKDINLQPYFKISCVKPVLWPILNSNAIDVSLSGGSLGYWTACNNFKRYCTLPYCEQGNQKPMYFSSLLTTSPKPEHVAKFRKRIDGGTNWIRTQTTEGHFVGPRFQTIPETTSHTAMEVGQTLVQRRICRPDAGPTLAQPILLSEGFQIPSSLSSENNQHFDVTIILTTIISIHLLVKSPNVNGIRCEHNIIFIFIILNHNNDMHINPGRTHLQHSMWY